MRKLIVMCSLVLALAGRSAWAEDNSPDPPPETETECPEDYHPVEGIEGACAQDDGTNDNDNACPAGCSPVGPTDYLCMCGDDFGDPEPPPSECPDGWHNYNGAEWVCVPDRPEGDRCPPACWWIPDYGYCDCQPLRAVILGDHDLTVVSPLDEYELVTHYNLDPEKGCTGDQAYDYTKDECAPACDFLADVPCIDEAPWLYW